MKTKKTNSNQLLMTILKGRTFIVLVILVVFFSVVKDNFLDPTTLTMIAKHVALYGILALGMTFVIITGGIDLSVGSVVGLIGMLAGGLNYGSLLGLSSMLSYGAGASGDTITMDRESFSSLIELMRIQMMMNAEREAGSFSLL